MTADWHDAQVIEATTPYGERHIFGRVGVSSWCLLGSDVRYGRGGLSDVRIIVGRDGNVAPQPITDEMVELAALALYVFDDGDMWDRETERMREYYRRAAGAALTAALGGAR